MVEDKSLIRKSVDSNDDDKYGLHPSKDINALWEMNYLEKEL